MKHTVEQLLLAAQVRAIAQSLREAKRQADRTTANLRRVESELPDIAYTAEEQARAEEARKQELKNEADARAFDSRWKAENPLTAFVPAALRELQDIADTISSAS